MNNRPSDSSGWVESLHGLGDSLLLLARTRLEIFAIEVQEEKFRFIRLAIWIGAAFALGAAGVLIGMGIFALWLLRTTGYAGVAALALSAVMGAAGLVCFVRRKIKHGPVPFGATIAEFKKDAECLRRN